jgi:hypothetical protein
LEYGWASQRLTQRATTFGFIKSMLNPQKEIAYAQILAYCFEEPVLA